MVSADPVNFTPNITNGKVEAIVQVGNRMIVAGTFTQAQNAGSTTTVTRNRILAFNATTGVIDTAFNPNVNGEITSMVVAPGGTAVIIAGTFTSVGGVAATRLAKLDAVTGARITAFTATAAGTVSDMALWGSKVILGGSFNRVDNVARTKVASVDAVTGALDPNVNLSVTGLFNGGSTNVQKLDVSPDNTKLVIVGNFTAVAGQSRVQIAMINLSAGPATVADWQTNDYSGACASVFNTYMRDVEFSPDGAYFVPVATGAGYFPTTLCDTATRWETSATGTDLHPTWIDYSGGDTYTAVAITGTAIYVGGHMRWLNNDIVGDVAAAGAVSRAGIGALDPQNGMPYRWNPTRDRGVGVFSFLATSAGLWVGHDTVHLGHETHNRIGMFPLAGGTTPPVGVDSTLPGTLYNLPPMQCSAGATPFLYRVNAGGADHRRQRLRSRLVGRPGLRQPAAQQRQQHRRLGLERYAERLRPRHDSGWRVRHRAVGSGRRSGDVVGLPRPERDQRPGPSVLHQPVRRDESGRAARVQRVDRRHDGPAQLRHRRGHRRRQDRRDEVVQHHERR